MQRSRPADFVPPYPAYTSRHPPDQSEYVMAQIGIQSRADADGGAMLNRIERMARAAGEGEPQHRERARHVDREGFRNEIVVLYWKRAQEMTRFWERADVRSWLEEPLSGAVGWWRECIQSPVGSLDANYSTVRATWGSGRHVPQTEEQFHGYYGSMRDRTPHFLDGSADAPAGQLAFVPAADSFGKRLRVSAPDKVCFIRGAFGWDQALPEEQRAFMDDMYPVYRAGAEFLRDHPLETNCISARPAEHVPTGESSFVQAETIAWFLTLKDLERWTHHHPTHAAIYGGVFKLMHRFNFQMRLNLGHEVAVVSRGQAILEYCNCHPHTGFLRFFPAMPVQAM
jgi:hypothetical protein